MSRTTDGGASGPATTSAGSPGVMCRMRNTSTDTPSSTGTAWTRRPATYDAIEAAGRGRGPYFSSRSSILYSTLACIFGISSRLEATTTRFSCTSGTQIALPTMICCSF